MAAAFLHQRLAATYHQLSYPLRKPPPLLSSSSSSPPPPPPLLSLCSPSAKSGLRWCLQV
ncbi:Hypothetical predicted protein [Xyrichtys novacula]|uniref:Uncharacterized protein n=1 Tax=Xyrichtys novacula TaxID=13765 RepID=A0AAV1H9T3_XYRNO|nr:Hypothetical predicted protein [Xyrichtys novacula]